MNPVAWIVWVALMVLDPSTPWCPGVWTRRSVGLHCYCKGGVSEAFTDSIELCRPALTEACMAAFAASGKPCRWDDVEWFSSAMSRGESEIINLGEP